jgi:serine-type D-Ala-D-Ala carboxypeptidase/endopeptidase
VSSRNDHDATRVSNQHPMTFRKPALLVIALAMSFSTTMRAQDSFAPDSLVRAILADRLAAKRGMGFVVAVLERGKPPRIHSAGVAGLAGVPLDGNTVFEIGSITKVFTGALLADMVARGEVRLDDPISKYLPSSVRVPSRNGRQITLGDLSTQSSGLPRLPTNLRPANIANPYADYSVAQLYEFLSGYTLPRDVGEKYEYSNLGVGLLGHVLSLRAGKPYGQLLKERILDPLGMTDTGIELTASMKRRMAQGFNAEGTPMLLWDLPTLAGAGALRSTANDMLKFLAANLDSSSAPIGSVLTKARTSMRNADRPGNRIGLGWHIVDVFGSTETWHNGGTGGFRAFIGLDEAKHRGVIVLSNSTITPDDIGFHLLVPQIPLDRPPGPVKQRVAISVDPYKLAPYVGVFELAPNFQLTVTLEGGSLFAQATGQSKLQLFPESETEFFLKVVDAQVIFVKDSTGKVNQLILHQNGAKIPGTRVGTK